jgi:hypothetical protein
MYEDEDEDWFINMSVQENASIAIVTPNPWWLSTWKISKFG